MTTETLQQIATTALQNQGNAILQLQQYITPQFANTVQLINNTTGRLICTGIGKSAIIAQKIVATLNSTGTPAIYMHAADAIHGDLGMVQPTDTLLVISKSGDSPEIKTLVPLLKNFGNTVIGMVGNMQSYLATNSHYTINTTIAAEACPINLAPTTSTTAQMVMGDVLAICLMQLKGFTPTNFAKYHPGGALGRKLHLTVADMYPNNPKPQVPSTATLQQVITEITKQRMGATAVTNNGTLVGIITDGDIRRLLETTNTLTNITAANITQPNAKTIAPTAMATEALNLMQQLNIMQLVVTQHNQYLGMVHLHDIIKEGIV